MTLRVVGSTTGRAVALAAALLLIGCGSDDAGSSATVASTIAAAPTPSVSPSSMPTPVPTALSGVIVQAGDSIGSGLGAGDWAAIDHLGFPPEVTIRNVSTPGKAMEAGYGNRQAELFVYRSNTAPSVLLIQQGSNDLYYGRSAEATYQAVLTPFVSAAHQAGFYVVVDTVLPRADGGWTTAMEQQRLAYNISVRGNVARADAVNDLAADPVLGDATSPAASPYYADAVHPNLAGQQRLATINAAVLEPFLRLAVRARSR